MAACLVAVFVRGASFGGDGSLFGGMLPASSKAATDEVTMNMIYNGGGHEDRQVEDDYSPQLEQETPTAPNSRSWTLPTWTQRRREVLRT